MRGAGFVEEGVFKGHRLIGEKRYDQGNMTKSMLHKTPAIPRAKSARRGMMLAMTRLKRVAGAFPKIVMVLMTTTKVPTTVASEAWEGRYLEKILSSFNYVIMSK